MTGVELDHASLGMEPIDPSAFAGRDEDLILPGDSLFGFSEAARIGEGGFGGTADVGGGSLSQQGKQGKSSFSFQANASLSLSPGPGPASRAGDRGGDGADAACSKTPSLLQSLSAAIKSASAREAGTTGTRGATGTETDETLPKASDAKQKPSRSRRRATTTDEAGAQASGVVVATAGRRYTKSMRRPRQGAGLAPADAEARESSDQVREGGGNPCSPPTRKMKRHDNWPLVVEAADECNVGSADGSDMGRATTGAYGLMAPASVNSGSPPRDDAMDVVGMELIPGFEDTLGSNFFTAFLQGSEGQVSLDPDMAFPGDHQEDLPISMGLAEALLQVCDTHPNENSGLARKYAVDETVVPGEDVKSVTAPSRAQTMALTPPTPLSPIPLENIPGIDLSSCAKTLRPGSGVSVAQRRDGLRQQSNNHLETPSSKSANALRESSREDPENVAESEENVWSGSMEASGASALRPLRDGTGDTPEAAPQDGQARRICHPDPGRTRSRPFEDASVHIDVGIENRYAGETEENADTRTSCLTATTQSTTSGRGDSGVAGDRSVAPKSTGGGGNNGVCSLSIHSALPNIFGVKGTTRSGDCVASDTDKRPRKVAEAVGSPLCPLPRKVSLRFVPREKSTQQKVAERGYLPFQKLTAPLSKPLEAVFKFMKNKWREVAVSDLNNIRIVFDAATTLDEEEASPQSAFPSKWPPSGRATLIWGMERSGESLARLFDSLPKPARARLCEEAFLDLTYTFVSGAVGPPPLDISSIWDDSPGHPAITSTTARRLTPLSTDCSSKPEARAAPFSLTISSPPRAVASGVQAPDGGLPEECEGEADEVIIVEDTSPSAVAVKEATSERGRTGIGGELADVAVAAVSNERAILARRAQKQSEDAPRTGKKKTKKAAPSKAKKVPPVLKSKRRGRPPYTAAPIITLTDAIYNRAHVGSPLTSQMMALAAHHRYMPGGIFASMHSVAMADRLRALGLVSGIFPPVRPVMETLPTRGPLGVTFSFGSASSAPVVVSPPNDFPIAEDPSRRMDGANDFPIAEDPSRSMDEANDFPIAENPSRSMDGASDCPLVEVAPRDADESLDTPAVGVHAEGELDNVEVCVDAIDDELIGEDSCMAAFGDCEINLLMEPSPSQQWEKTAATVEKGARAGVGRLPQSLSSPGVEVDVTPAGFLDPPGKGEANTSVANGLQVSLLPAPHPRTGRVKASGPGSGSDHKEAPGEAMGSANRASGEADAVGVGTSTTAGSYLDATEAIFPPSKVVDEGVGVGLAAPLRQETVKSAPPLDARPISMRLDPRTADGTATTEREECELPNVEQLRIASSSAGSMTKIVDDAVGAMVVGKPWREEDASATHPTSLSILHDDALKVRVQNVALALKAVKQSEGPVPSVSDAPGAPQPQSQLQLPTTVEVATSSSRPKVPSTQRARIEREVRGDSTYAPSRSPPSLPRPVDMGNLPEGAMLGRTPYVEEGRPAYAATASALGTPLSPPSLSSLIQLLPETEQRDVCANGASEPDGSSFDCFRAKKVIDLDEIATLKTDGHNLRLRSEEGWSVVGATTADIAAQAGGVGLGGLEGTDDRRGGGSRSYAGEFAVLGSSGEERFKRPAERPGPDSKEAQESPVSDRIPETFTTHVSPQEPRRPTSVGGSPRAATATTTAGGSVACGGAVATTEATAQVIYPRIQAPSTVGFRPFAFAAAARKADPLTSSASVAAGPTALTCTGTNAQSAPAKRARSSASNTAASLVPAPFETLLSGGAAARDEVQASYAEAWSSFPSFCLWDDASVHRSSDAHAEMRPQAALEGPVTRSRSLALARADCSLEGLLDATTTAASATNGVSAGAGAGCRYDGKGQRGVTPSSGGFSAASPGSNDPPASASYCRTSSSHSDDLKRARATDRAAGGGDPLPTLIRLGRSMSKGLTTGKAAGVAGVAKGPASVRAAAAPGTAPTNVSTTLNDYGWKSTSLNSGRSLREKRNYRDNDENVNNQAVGRGSGGDGREMTEVLPRPRKRPKKGRIVPTLVGSLPSAPSTAAATAFSRQ